MQATLAQCQLINDGPYGIDTITGPLHECIRMAILAISPEADAHTIPSHARATIRRCTPQYIAQGIMEDTQTDTIQRMRALPLSQAHNTAPYIMYVHLRHVAPLYDTYATPTALYAAMAYIFAHEHDLESIGINMAPLPYSQHQQTRTNPIMRAARSVAINQA